MSPLLRGPRANPDSISVRDVVLVSPCPLASTDAHILKRKIWKKLSSGRCIGILGPRGVRTGPTAYVGRVLDFFESFPFFQIRRGLRVFVGPVAQHAFVFRAILVP